MAKVIHLKTAKTSCLIDQSSESIPSILYYGERIDGDVSDALVDALQFPITQATLDLPTPISLLPEHGMGMFSAFGLRGHRNGQAWSTQFKCEQVNESDNAATVVCEDELAQLRIEFDIRFEEGVLAIRSKLTNLGDEDFDCQQLSLTMPIQDYLSEAMSFHGHWSKEFQTKRHDMMNGAFVVENNHGRTGHDRIPYVCVGTPGFGEWSGEVLGFHFAWSGNHKYSIEQLNNGRRVVQFSESFFPGEMFLKSGESYETPTLYIAHSSHGLVGVTEKFHALTRSLCKHNKPRPIHFNSWEAVYFDHDKETLFSLVDAAAEVGVERFILDDGWFKGRNDDTAALGDWIVDAHKYPQGLKPLIDHVKSSGMEFGLWVEPEMVNPDSDCFRAHPDWVLQVEGYDQRIMRNQYVIDLTNPDAFKYIFDCLDALLAEYDIAYFKWDMNRALVQAANHGYPVIHKQTKAVYQLLADLREKHPDVEIESCSSGGGRIDLGILRYTSRVWLSDCNDPYERQISQKGFSVFLPPEIMGSHIGPAPAHTTLRSHNLAYRAMTALFAHMGIEWDFTKLSVEEKAELKSYLDLYKQHRDFIHSNDSVRFDYCDEAYAYGVIAKDKSRALVQVAQIETPVHEFNPHLRIPGLDLKSNYEVKMLKHSHDLKGQMFKSQPEWIYSSVTLSGELLAKVGLQMPGQYAESAALFSMKKV